MSDSATTATDTRIIEPNVATLLARAGRSTTFTLEPLPGGRNNRTYRVRADDHESLLKWYFSHPGDDRDRLGTEFAFSGCLWRHGLRQIAQPLAEDRSAGLGLYEFLPGRPLSAGDVTLEHHDQAIAFLRRINALRPAPDVLSLAPAAEACFSLLEHVARVGHRLQRLAAIDPKEPLDREMAEFIRCKLQPAFEQQRAALEQWAARDNVDMQRMLRRDEQCLSPSDFGFHNALLQDDGSLRFVDFEYAGWDDPAKLVGDFFCQVEVPAVASGCRVFLDGVAQMCTEPAAVVQRTRRLFPLYQIKWCCIVLNDFLPPGDARRTFSGPSPAKSRRTEQLAVARRLCDLVGCMPGPSW